MSLSLNDSGRRLLKLSKNTLGAEVYVFNSIWAVAFLNEPILEPHWILPMIGLRAKCIARAERAFMGW